MNEPSLNIHVMLVKNYFWCKLVSLTRNTSCSSIAPFIQVADQDCLCFTMDQEPRRAVNTIAPDRLMPRNLLGLSRNTTQ